MIDLSTQYLGLKLKNPLVASASPLSKKVDTVKKLEDAGIGAVVMYSLFEEQIIHESHALDYFLSHGTESFSEALTYFPDMEHYNVGPDGYLDMIRKLKESVQVPVIASLNGISTGGWVDYARKMEQAGADALELNIYFLPTDLELEGIALEDAYVELVRSVRAQVKIPLAVKLSPYFTALPNFARKLVGAGANGLVLFNRFYQPDLDIETLEVVPDLVLSTSDELRLPLRWTAILYGRLQADLALTTGVHSVEDVVKATMAGARVSMMASELLSRGIGRVSEILADLEKWLETYEYHSIQQMLGSMSQQAVADPAAFERANYMKVLQSFDRRL
ncbi:MAG TPA: dihydroorotate dehydrogenase-like protein [Anaerolineaceae bacterium]|jgi:dihydroorotate dehydrogenase (fumarate)|nr:dihydroorotate dehydrogenase-like protein [Anaerolineaceae bacterium]HNY99670.1 dihydroorotate dehydrogenase-like protein [Anaerolineaceae bacterium]HOH19080.1 dihydroorotate dehydrogenase-like protein [Anaerolineaceae bacterium]HPA32283.1 dihydroorotate dehydrogenase-like protein [Anaerolineaceae bacterium]HQO97200.1 dihydroorotate dehydrogenase-like protein [Anaerolineaceae bacterium]